MKSQASYIQVKGKQMKNSDDISTLSKKWKKILLDLWDDPNLKDSLLKYPEKTLSKLGFQTPDSQSVKIHENSDKTLHLVIPQKPNTKLTDEVLAHIVAGFHYGGE